MNRLVPWLGANFIRTLHATLRVRHVRPQTIEAMNAAGQRYVLAFWHEHLLLMLHSRHAKPICVMSSQSKDGDLMVQVYAHYGVRAVRGSSSRGGSNALRALIRLARSGSSVAFTPDGPRGPARVVKDGMIHAARSTGLPIIPLAFAAARFKRLRSWDRMIVPMPLSRALFLYGEPIPVPRDADVEHYRLMVESRMNELAAEGETKFEALWAASR